ncbi:MAG: GNAT family N-acetyltransferase [Candidatus Binatia bacterium]
MPLESTHPRFDVRRARPAEFEALYDVVDAAFGYKRPRAVYDWFYRRNPYGTARCWIVIDRASGQVIGSAAWWPWPMAHGEEPSEGTLGADWAVAPQWQRQGIPRLRAEVWASHPWYGKATGISWPNEKSRGSGIKRGRADRIVGPVPRAILPLDAEQLLASRGWPSPVCRVAGIVADSASRAARGLFLPRAGDVAIEPMRRFETAFDAVTYRCMAWHGFWSPHDAEFLNWRYIEHPAGGYVAFAAAAGAEPVGYCVLRLAVQDAWLMELAAPAAPSPVAGALVRHAVEVARAAGCTCLKFSAPPQWRHWRLLRRAGFLPVPSDIYVWPGGEVLRVRQLDQWQWVPGDMDAR